MAPISPIVGDLSIQTGGGNSTDLLVQNIGVDGCTLAATPSTGDATTDASAALTSVTGLIDWNVSAPFKFPGDGAQSGANASGAMITGSGIYLSNIREFSLTLDAPFAAAGNDGDIGSAYTMDGATKIRSDVLSASGSWRAWVDSSTVLGAIGATATGLFVLADEGAGTDDAISIPLIVTGMNVVRARGSTPVAVDYQFASTGQIQYQGTASLFGSAASLTNLPDPGIGSDASETLRVTHASGKYAEGEAYWSQIALTRAIDGVVGGTVQFAGTGGLTLA